ncbi:class I SAM-dependent methyltransferase [Ahrensia marina]|uniref:class I SAM-dependent methyltransferase n=1 Tax=Ahrensia marina TaxID=1514904 RepID=UPI0006B469CB|nr:class I SAM-dependent methyltransferase [Ahrensia marina]
MNRETTNWVRFAIEELIPPIVRDSGFFRSLMKLAWGKHIDDLARFRERAAFLTDEEYTQLYRDHPRVHEGTDNSQACIDRIVKDVTGHSVADIGCGTGVLLNHIRNGNSDLQRLAGVDFVIDDASKLSGIEYFAARIENLPFKDNEFDTVVCTHVLEHVLDFRKSLTELRRVAAKRVIIVVPREREYKYSFNPHFNFFPYKQSFLRAAFPIPTDFKCDDIGRDIYYVEDIHHEQQASAVA